MYLLLYRPFLLHWNGIEPGVVLRPRSGTAFSVHLSTARRQVGFAQWWKMTISLSSNTCMGGRGGGVRGEEEEGRRRMRDREMSDNAKTQYHKSVQFNRHLLNQHN